MARRAVQGTGTIRKKTVLRAGKEYSYWEARYTAGTDPGTGKQLQRSITGKTQKEVAQKLKAATASIDAGTYTAPNKLSLGEWLDIWAKDYLGGVKPFTVVSYKGQIKNHIKPALGAVRLEALNAHTIQSFYNGLSEPKEDKTGLSPKSVKNVHGVLHKALQQAVAVGYLRFNPTDACTLPRAQRKELKPLDEEQSKAFLAAIKGHRLEYLFTTTLFTGMREGEALGLLWSCVDLKTGTILIKQQLQREKKKNGLYIFAPLKNDKTRTITPAPWVIQLLRAHRTRQTEQRLKAGDLWEDSGLVFTDELGHHLAIHTVYKEFKKVVASIGSPDTRFHDLRHSYAVAAIRSGDDIKTVQGNLGHATAAFTLDVYGHVTDQMKKESAARMDSYIKDVLNL
ncbi:putative site-specific recombinase [uncultured Eubacteriales bacterium]|uniref:Putative site-specific recombinase n=1 Tax=uncultured Eubacteriales bacterium TaxID=172733 RepID=A0A212JT46_9FIRM|nr:putative site-specific recombinase [uncultured Eubacteriales bacterium]